MAMRRQLLATLVTLFLVPTVCSAGGYHIDIKLEAVEFKGNNEFTITFRQVGGQPLFDSEQPVVFHLRHAVNAQTSMASEATYVSSINYLLTQFREGEPFEAGIAFQPTPIAGASNEFQVDGIFGGPDHLHFIKERTQEN